MVHPTLKHLVLAYFHCQAGYVTENDVMKHLFGISTESPCTIYFELLAPVLLVLGELREEGKLAMVDDEGHLWKLIEVSDEK